MNELVTKLLRLKLAAKVGLTAGLMFVVVLLYNFMFLSDLEDEIKAAESQNGILVTEKASYEKRKSEYLAYRNETAKLLEEQREVQKALPRKTEMSSFLQSIQEQAQLSGVDLDRLDPDPNEIPEDLYVKILVKIEIAGSYHSITKFFKHISELQRIVNLENVSLNLEKPGAPESDPARSRLKARFVAVTYKFADQGGDAGGGK